MGLFDAKRLSNNYPQILKRARHLKRIIAASINSNGAIGTSSIFIVILRKISDTNTAVQPERDQFQQILQT